MGAGFTREYVGEFTIVLAGKAGSHRDCGRLPEREEISRHRVAKSPRDPIVVVPCPCVCRQARGARMCYLIFLLVVAGGNVAHAHSNHLMKEDVKLKRQGQ
ncbi:hypothetical protein PSEEN2860 [Pseudomonas entomophila L48]|uniref:Uncharacterized protein n=1 Tax=Pseudomonas entomophila (strain L48) TaxID=384676 RepID=Q1I9N7_PSEE4|nr:hypothetical protein PSEEN2860 [Pseudomonas entomophila L48]